MKSKRAFLLANIGLWGIALAVLVLIGLTARQDFRAIEGGAEASTTLAAADARRPAPALGADGLFVEDFYRPSTGDLAKDLASATSEGKILVVFWEREGCPYCETLHEMLREPALHAYVADTFYTVRLDFYGRKPVRDYDGAETTESDLARRHRVVGTPTMEFRMEGGKEVLRIPGLVEADVLQAAFEFAATGAYANGNINEWLRGRGMF